MADIGIVAEKRYATLGRVLEALDLEELQIPSTKVDPLLTEMFYLQVLERLEAVMNSITNGLGMRETEIANEPSRPWNPHFYAVFAQVHNTL